MKTICDTSNDGRVSLRSNSVVINGVPTWLISGAVHYFRIPRQNWRSCLQLCVDGGLNCIDTYVAWNVHEKTEGAYDFSGECDIEHFIELAGELGLHVIVRLGPYICAEHRQGGYPTWLLNKEGITLREPNAAHLDAVNTWFDQLLPRISRLQANHGGPVILVQCENEYAFRDRPGGRDYLLFLRDRIYEAGINVPIITCNSLSISIEGLVECYNGRNDFTRQLNLYSAAQEGMPRFVSEYYPGWFSIWNEPYVEHRSPRQVFRDAIDITANGGMLNYYMYAGGTNFGFQAGRSGLGRNRFITTSCDYQSPIGEGLLIGEKYAVTRLANNIIRLFSPVFISNEFTPASTAHTGWCVIERKTDKGSLIFAVRREDTGDTKTAIHTSHGECLLLDSGDSDAFVLPYQFDLSDQIHINSTCFQPFGTVGRYLLMYGKGGANGQIAINGESICVTIPTDDGVVHEERIGDIHVLLMTARSAAHTIFSGNSASIGANIQNNGTVNGSASGFDAIIDVHPQGMTRREPVSVEPPDPPQIASIQRLHTDSALLNNERFKPIDCPMPLDAIYPGSGYIWYSLDFETDDEQDINLFFTDAADRVHFYIDGHRQGIFGPGEGASHTPIRARTKQGHNRWLFLIDALGYRNSTIPLEDPKGLWGMPETASEVTVLSDSLSSSSNPGKEYEHTWSSARRREASYSEYWTRTVRFRPPTTSKGRLWLTLQTFASGSVAWLFLNNKLITTHDGALHPNHRNISIDASELRDVNELEIIVEGPQPIAEMLNAQFLMLSPIVGKAFRWGTAEWALPVDNSPFHETDTASPAWWESRFSIQGQSALPLFMKCTGLSKGVAFLNGHNIGRYWNGSSQEHYYLPNAWLKSENAILFYDEDGCSPEHIQLEYLDRPVSEIRLNGQTAPADTYKWQNNV